MYGSGTAIGGYRHSLWFVDILSKHIEKYTLKSLAPDELLKSIRLLRRYMGGRYPDKMIVDREFKLIGGQVYCGPRGYQRRQRR